MAQTKPEPQIVENDEPKPMEYEPEVTQREVIRSGRVSDPNAPQVVNPMVDTPTEGIGKLSEVFGKAHVVDQVMERPLQGTEEQQMLTFVIRPNMDIEDMTIGAPDNHFSFKAGVRYRVPGRVAHLLLDQEKLLEMPYPYEP